MIRDDPSEIVPVLTHLKAHTHKMKDVAFRKRQLMNLQTGLNDLEGEFKKAFEKDFGIVGFNCYLSQIAFTKTDLVNNIQNVEKWTKPKSINTSLIAFPGSSKIVYEPLGVVLVISSWNYPLYTAIPPIAGAIAAGNCVVLKPSELAPYSSNLLVQLFKYLDQDCFRIIEGGIQVAQTITRQPFDLIIFTGSPEKGKLVAKAASENLVPCILELGGKSPTIIDNDAKLQAAAQRIIQCRYANAGQTCIACDYILIHEDVVGQFAEILKREMLSWYGSEPYNSKDYNRIITEFHTQRLADMITEDHGGAIIVGGQFDVKQKYVAPTVVMNPKLTSKMMTEEIFGPILPIITFKNLSDAIKFVNERPKPLILYYFGGRSSHQKMIENYTSSGSLSINDTIMNMICHEMPFGGVGNSGYGAYHGKAGFLGCSHAKPVLNKSTLNIYPLSARYAPYTEHKQKILNLFFKMSEVTQAGAIKGVVCVSAVLCLSILAATGQLTSLYRYIARL